MYPSRILSVAALLLLLGGLLLAIAEHLLPTRLHKNPDEQFVLQMLKETSREDFYRNIVPLARQESQLILYNHAASFPALWSNIVIPRFEAKYGVRVILRNVQDNVAHQQLMAAHVAQRPAPVDVFFTSGAHLPAYKSQGLLLDISLADRLPEAMFYDLDALQQNQGIDHEGRFMPFHRNQAALGYDSVVMSNEAVPQSLDALMTWVEAHPGRFAWSSPLRGGSGRALLVAVARHTMSVACLKRFEANDYAASAQSIRLWMRESGCFAQTWEWLRKLRSLSEITNGNAESLRLIANGRASIAAIWEDQAYTFIMNKQLPSTFRMIIPSDGLPGGMDGLFIPTGARHVAAAALFIDFALSEEIQQWKLEKNASRSARRNLDHSQVILNQISEKQIVERSTSWPSPQVVQALVDAFVENVLQKDDPS